MNHKQNNLKIKLRVYKRKYNHYKKFYQKLKNNTKL